MQNCMHRRMHYVVLAKENIKRGDNKVTCWIPPGTIFVDYTIDINNVTGPHLKDLTVQTSLNTARDDNNKGYIGGWFHQARDATVKNH